MKRQCHGQMKNDKKDKHWSTKPTEKDKDWATRTSQIFGGVLMCSKSSAGFRTNDALYLGPEGGKPDRLTQAVNSIIMSGVALKQSAFKFKIVPHKQKSIINCFGQKDGPLANGALWLSTSKHNVKSGTVWKG